MKILFIESPDLLYPWYDDFLEAIGGRHEVILYEYGRPVEEQFRDIDIVVDRGGRGTHAMIDAAFESGVKLWQVIGTGLDHLDVRYIQQKGIPVANTPGLFSGIALAEHALFLMLCLAKNLSTALNNIRAGTFAKPINDELEGKTLGLVGFGASARALAQRAWPLGMRILAIDTVPVPQNILEGLHVEFFGGPQQLDQLLAEADYVSVHVPLTSETRNMIDQRALRLMKPTACLINVARGAIVDEPALIEALQGGWIKGAGLDTFAHEPLPLSSPLLHMENVITTPHIAGVTWGTSKRRGRAAAENVDRVAQGLPPLYQAASVE
jgi:phosphoglycerate dehydrogenase-like enzyme